jgi:hypothetical protein
MKKLLIATMGLLTGAFVNAQTTEPSPKPSAAQYISVGPTAGIGGNWVGNMGGESHFAPTGNIGVSVIYAKQEHWGLGGQALFAAWGYDKEYNGERAASVPVYLRLPMRGYYFFGKYTDKIRPKLFLGPELGVKLGEWDYVDNGPGDLSINQRTGSFRTFDVGFSTGGGVNIELRKSVWLNLDLSYYQGLTDVVKDPAGRHNVNHNLGASAGILFGINH